MKVQLEKKVLIVEDDQEINHLLTLIFAKLGIVTVSAFSGTEGLLQLNNQKFDILLLDLMLPGMSGEELIKQVRLTSDIPIIVLSAKNSMEDQLYALRIGADDYITKPFNQEELAVRVEVQLRKTRNQPTKGSNQAWREIVIYPEQLIATLEGKRLELTNSEYAILSMLVEHPEHAFSKQKIYEQVWNGNYVGDDNTISVHVSNLRKKMAEITTEEYIKTIWGIGFMLV